MDISPADAERLFSKLPDYPDGIVVLDGGGSVRFANPLARLYFGMEGGALEGRTFDVSARPGDTIEHETGGRSLELRSAVLKWAGEDGCLLTVRDVSARKRSELQLSAAMSDLKLALASEKVLLNELDKKNKELTELSITDGLTGLYNHRYLQERLEFEFKRVKRYGGNLSCMMIDIDHFKALNDTYGHQCGDFVLRELSDLVRLRSREVDICARYGGEEFVILTSAAIEYAVQHASKLHATIDAHEFSWEGRNLHVTVSIGVADYRPGMQDRAELIGMADTAMYRAKTDGRNLIRVWKEKPSCGEPEIDCAAAQELKRKFAELTARMRSEYMEQAVLLVNAVDARDPFAKEHSPHVSVMAAEIARDMGLPDPEIEMVGRAALLHDVGKIAVSKDILLKRTPLTKEEVRVIRKHPDVGVDILKDIRIVERELPFILYHHERFDGTGYPHRLKGREIPMGARIIAVADAFDAMTSGRAYRKQMSIDDAAAGLSAGAGSQFSPDVVDVFLRIFKRKTRPA
jgi:diguanylate cyclase (GGDEF)-like protein/putative nucleotidyltransferase with HDIG domain